MGYELGLVEIGLSELNVDNSKTGALLVWMEYLGTCMYVFGGLNFTTTLEVN